MTPEVLTPDVLKSNTNIFKTSSNKNSRNYQLTLNDHNGNLLEKYELIKDYLLNLKNISYFLAVREIGIKTKNDHIHIYAHFNNKIRLSIKKIQGAHIEICYGLPKHNIGYLLKNFNTSIIESDYPEYKEIIEYYKLKQIEDGGEPEESTLLDEVGERPHQGQKNYNYNELINLTTEDILNNEDLNLLQKRTALNLKKEAHNQPLNKNNFIKNMNIYYIYTNNDYNEYKDKLYDKAFEIIGDNEFDEIEFKDGFIIGYKITSHFCIIPEFNDKIFDLYYFKKFIDKYKHNINIKGGEAKNNYDNIIFLSNQSPYNIYNLNIDDKLFDILKIIRIK